MCSQEKFINMKYKHHCIISGICYRKNIITKMDESEKVDITLCMKIID